jgi:PTS system nitrogen regulatory IIA component
MDVRELIKPDRIMLGLKTADKTELLRELANRASGFTAVPADTIHKLLSGREEFGSTGIGRGIALPHATVQGRAA